jgi:hypothetical protein
MKKPNPIRTRQQKRLTRLQVMLSADELTALDNFRFEKRMPSRAAAIREILRRGLTVNGFDLAGKGLSSSEFGVLESDGRNPVERVGAARATGNAPGGGRVGL